MHSTLARRIEHIRKDVLPFFDTKNTATLKSQIEQIFSPEESNRYIKILRNDSDVAYLSGTPQDKSFNPQSVKFNPYYLANNCEQGVSSSFDNNLLILGCKTKVSKDTYLIEMGVPVTETNRVLHQFIITLIVGLAIVIIIAIFGGIFLLRLALAPVEAIRSAAEKITYGNLSQRLPVAVSGDPIEHLSKTLNRMLDRLDQASQNAGQFSSDVSHELRTPLAIIRRELEALRYDKALSFDNQNRLGSILEEIERLSAIVESLLTIARLEGGEAKTENQLINLSKLVHSTIEQMQLLADEKRISVSISARDSVFVRGDVARLKQIIVNLFDNAVKYTPNGGYIEISVFIECGRALLTLQDSGVGISLEALPHIFERFYRADKVRSYNSQGTGLGLFIVRTIAQAHGGVINVQSKESLGTLVEVTLPLETLMSTDD